jgi:predicted  nucleic acid-binding Zn-ribbon protein
MRETLEQLEALQTLNGRISQLRRDAEMLDVDVRNQERLLQEKKRRAEQAHQERLEAVRKADALQMRIEEAEAEIGRMNVQLNTTKHQKEFDTIQHSVLSRRADIRKSEDEGLALLAAADGLAAEEQRLAEEMREAQQQVAAVNQQVQARRASVEREISECRQEAEHLRQQIRPPVLSAYERLSNGRVANPLSRVRNRICEGCHTQITKQTENLLMRDDKLVYCHSCGRLLMLVD